MHADHATDRAKLEFAIEMRKQFFVARALPAQRGPECIGINLDEETQNLIKYQNAYQATARSMNIMDSLLSTVINTLGTGH